MNESKKKKYLFIYLKTGGGHLAPAKAIAQYLDKNAKDDVGIKLVDGFADAGWFVKFVIEDGYRILQNKAKWLYELIYAIHKIKFVSEISGFLVSIFIEKTLTKTILEERPDKIILFHFFAIKPIYRIKKRNKLLTPVITVVTDPYIAHPLWFLRENQNFIVFSQELKQRCIKDNINEENIKVFPFPLDEKFSKPASVNEITEYKNKRGFVKNKTLLVLGGGDGIPKGAELLKNILELNPDCEIAFVCGRNEKLYKKALEIKNKWNIDNLKVYGYIDFVYELISISDVVITKCGASTFMEILISKKIPVVNSYIWEQEKGNVDFIVANKLGIYEKNIKILLEKIAALMNEPELIEKYKHNIENVRLENGTEKVAKYINS
jgi:UDP-N-acetylglucosamine:LPS N-acetylglucosamine transferase